ncbi:MAG: PaaI family thioesterase [Nitrospirae bacterium]|nr:PaaI family thioesterase [Nitrospirota bacterium]
MREKPYTIPKDFDPGEDGHPYADLHGMRWTRDKRGTWWITLKTTPKLLNPNRVLHGGVLFTLADTAMGRTVTSLLGPGEECASIEVRIHHLRMVRSGTLKSRAWVVHRGRRIIVLEAEVVDAQDRLVSKASGTMYVMRKPS